MDNGKAALNPDQLGRVTGGTANIPAAKYHIGDRVSLIVYPEYGVGVINQIINKVPGGYDCVVIFDAGIITADESEFTPA